MTRIVGLALALTPSIACVIGPTVDALATKATPVHVTGYSLAASRSVALDCKKVGTSSVHSAFATTTSAATAGFTSGGGSVYAFAKDAVIPADCWVPAGPGIAAARVYARDVTSGNVHLHVEDVLCAAGYMIEGADPATSGLACAEPFRHLELHAPSGIVPGANPLAGLPAVQQLASGFGWLEGPIYDYAANGLYFTDIANDKIHKYALGSVSTSVQGSGTFTNGMDYDGNGNRVECQHKTQRVVHRTASGTTVVASTWQNHPFNSPNDVISHAKGALFFTDPTYGSWPNLGAATPHQPYQGVYRVDIDGPISLVSSALSQPNGIALSPDHATLYVADTASNEIVAFPVDEDGFTGAAVSFADVDTPDGMTVDIDGNLYVASASGVVVLAPSGSAWGTIPVPAQPTNVAFGEVSTLFITTQTTLYSVQLPIPGLPASF